MSTFFLVISQFFSLILGVAKSFLLPIVLSVESFGYWQVYLLYIGYLGFFSMGFNDGLLIRYGKYNANELPIQKLGNSIKIFISFQILVSILLITFILKFNQNKDIYIYILVIINIPIVVINGIFLSLLQSTNQIKKYSVYTIVDKILMVFTIMFFYFFKYNNLYILISLDIFSRLIVIFIMYKNFNYLFSFKKLDSEVKTRDKILEIITNMNSGIYIMFSNIVGMLIIGLPLIMIERFLSIKQYSIFSFGISTTNLIIVFITAISVSVYPFISRMETSEDVKFYRFLEKKILYSIIIFSYLYFVIAFFIARFIPKFDETLDFLPYIFVTVLLQIKLNILITPYIKKIRIESYLFKCNLYMILLSMTLVSLVIYNQGSLKLIAAIISISLLLKNQILSNKVEKELGTKQKQSFFFLEHLYYFIFLISIYSLNNLIHSMILMLLYGILTLHIIGFRYINIIKYFKILKRRFK